MATGKTSHKLHFTPCLPANWTTFTLHYRYRETVYHISVVQAAGGKTRVTVDGVERSDPAISLFDYHLAHRGAVTLPPFHGYGDASCSSASSDGRAPGRVCGRASRAAGRASSGPSDWV